MSSWFNRNPIGDGRLRNLNLRVKGSLTWEEPSKDDKEKSLFLNFISFRSLSLYLNRLHQHEFFPSSSSTLSLFTQQRPSMLSTNLPPYPQQRGRWQYKYIDMKSEISSQFKFLVFFNRLSKLVCWESYTTSWHSAVLFPVVVVVENPFMRKVETEGIKFSEFFFSFMLKNIRQYMKQSSIM